MFKKVTPLLLSFFLFLPQLASAQGFLIPTNRRLSPLGLKYYRVSVKITDRAARTRVQQVFVNSTNRQLEATFIFPLPKGAVVSNFVLYINGKRTKGQVLVRERASAIYRSIVSRMRDPGLIEYIGNNLFRARIFPIPPRGEQKIEIAFTQMVPYRLGLHRYIYPLKGLRGMKRTMQDFTMSIILQSKTPLKNIYSPTHRISLARRGDRKAIIGFEKNQAFLNRDFVLYYSVSPKDIGINVMTYRPDAGKDGYFLMMATPKSSYSSKELMGKNITFVIDTSGSMSGAKMRWARKALISCLKKLNPQDYFNVIRFSTDVEPLFPQKLRLATPKTIQKAIKFVQRFEAAGGTAIDEAMRLALKQPPRGKGVSIVVFITDGYPTIGETEPKLILRNSLKLNRYKKKIFTFGIGTSINTKLLDLLALSNRGIGDYVKPNREIAERIAWFYDKIRYPVLSNIQLKVSNKVRLLDLYPKKIPDLYRGGQILLFGRYRGHGHVAITLSGLLKGQNKRFVFEAEFKKKSTENAFIEPLWAHRKVAYLLENIRLHGEKSELKQEVIRLAKKYGIVTPYTSYLVVEERDRWRLKRRIPRSSRPLIMRRRRARRMRLFRGRGIGGAAPNERGIGGAAPAPRATSQDDATGSLRNWKSTSGKGAVDSSKKLRKMKESSVLSSRSSRKVRYISGHLFIRRGHRWIDKKFKSSMKTIRIRYMSRRYFQMLRLRPSLRKFLVLGKAITIVIGKNKAIIIGHSETSLSKKQLAHFLK